MTKTKEENNVNEKENESRIIKKFGSNVFTSMISLFAIKVLGFIYRALLFNVDGYTNEANGFYSAGYELYALMLAIIATGIPNIIARITAEKIGENKKKEAQKVFSVSIKFFGIISLFLSFFLYFFADYISINIYKVPEISLVIKVLSPAIFFVALSSIIRGHFTGMGDVRPSNTAQLLEQFLNCSLTILFAYLASGRPPHVIAAAANVSTTISVVIAFLYLSAYLFRFRKKEKIKEEPQKSGKEILKEILKITIPITIGAFIGVFNIFIDSVTVTRGIQEAFKGSITSPELLREKAMAANGIISKVYLIVTAPQVLSQAFANILITSVAYYKSKDELKKAGENVTNSLKVLFMFLFPSMIGIIALAPQLLYLIFPAAPDGSTLLMLFAVVGLIVSFNMVFNSALNGLGLVKIPPMTVFLAVVIKTILNIILIPNPSIHIYGAPIASIISQLVIFIITYIIIRKKLNANLGSFKYISKIIFASTLMGLSAYYSHKALMRYIGTRPATIVSVFIGGGVYLALIILLKALDKEVLKNIPFVSKFLNSKTKDKNDEYEDKEEKEKELILEERVNEINLDNTQKVYENTFDIFKDKKIIPRNPRRKRNGKK